MGPDVHFRLTFDLAREAGFDEATAERIARADVEVDSHHPARQSLGALSRHFVPTAWVWALVYYLQSVRDRDPAALGRALHCMQDAFSHGWLGMAHVRLRLGIGRDPDDWDGAPGWERHLIESGTRRLLSAHLRRVDPRPT